MDDIREFFQDPDAEQAADDAADAREAEAEKQPAYNDTIEPFEKPPGSNDREDMLKPDDPDDWPRYRSAITGAYVTAEYARQNPDTTVREED